MEFLTTSCMKLAANSQAERDCASSQNHAKAWKTLKKFRSSSEVIPIAMDTLTSHFSSLAKPNECPLLPKPLPEATSRNDRSHGLTSIELQAAIENMNVTSAPGPDGLPPYSFVSPFQTLQSFTLC